MLTRQEWNRYTTILQIEQLYNNSCRYAWWGRILQRLTGRSRALYRLTENDRSRVLAAEFTPEPQPVMLDRIRGTGQGDAPFDRAFHPLHRAHTGHWKRMATALANGDELPPVELIRVGDDYYVQDGHYRISVARALGQSYIDAYVGILKDNDGWRRSTRQYGERAMSGAKV